MPLSSLNFANVYFWFFRHHQPCLVKVNFESSKRPSFIPCAKTKSSLPMINKNYSIQEAKMEPYLPTFLQLYQRIAFDSIQVSYLSTIYTGRMPTSTTNSNLSNPAMLLGLLFPPYYPCPTRFLLLRLLSHNILCKQVFGVCHRFKLQGIATSILEKHCPLRAQKIPTN